MISLLEEFVFIDDMGTSGEFCIQTVYEHSRQSRSLNVTKRYRSLDAIDHPSSSEEPCLANRGSPMASPMGGIVGSLIEPELVRRVKHRIEEKKPPGPIAVGHFWTTYRLSVPAATVPSWKPPDVVVVKRFTLCCIFDNTLVVIMLFAITGAVWYRYVARPSTLLTRASRDPKELPKVFVTVAQTTSSTSPQRVTTPIISTDRISKARADALSTEDGSSTQTTAGGD
ncbi:hypothetical protein MTO96_017375 [Rhipicephalus appendiculatus]